MLIPYGTDAPTYHYPFTTIAVIILNTCLFCLTGMGDSVAFRWLILEFDQINPLQWITAAFMHASWMHLVGNMIFLWCFGLVVEGKIGWFRFAILYLCLAAADGAIGQIPMFVLYGGPGGALGASGVIFALIAVSLVWAPDNDMHCLFTWSLYYIRQIDVRIIHLAFFYFGLQLLQLAFIGFHMSTPMLHLLGMSVGFPFAIYMLRYGLVDCEGWDLFSRYGTGNPWGIASRALSKKPRRGNSSAMTVSYNQSAQDALKQVMANPTAFSASVSNPPSKDPGKSPTKLQRTKVSANAVPTVATEESPPAYKLCRAIEGDELNRAVYLFDHISLHWGTHVISENILARYAELLCRHRFYEKSLQPLQVLVSRRSKISNRARLQIAKIQLQVLADAEAAAITLKQMVRPWCEQTDRKRKKLLVLVDQTINSKPYADPV